jgi:hypothetical protein
VRFQAVLAPQDGPMPQLVADFKGLRWPKGMRRPSTGELEAALGALAASIAATGWEPIQSHGPWSERRFVWRQGGDPPTSFELGEEHGGRGTAVAEVLRLARENPGVTLPELAAAAGVKPAALAPLLRTLTARGELEECTLPGGETGYALAAERAGVREAPR